MSQITHNALQRQIDQYTREILNATEKSWEALKNKDRKKNVFWLDEKKRLTDERTELQKKLQLTSSEENTSIKPKTRQEIKEKIISLNKMAKEADQKMRLALVEKQLSQANDFLRQRNQYNGEVKQLNELLNPPKEDKTPKPQTKKAEPSLSREEIKIKIRGCNTKALEADKKMRVALANRELEKANELLQQRNYLNSEAKKLALLLQPPRIHTQNTQSPKSISPKSKTEKQQQAVEKEVVKPVLTREMLKNKIRECNAKARQADKDMRVALAEKRLIKANELLQQRNQFNKEGKELLKQLQTPAKQTRSEAKEPVKEKVLSREEIKAKIKQANQNALKADASIRASLNAKQYQKANDFLAERKKFAAESKALMLLLNPVKPPSSDEKSFQVDIKKQTKVVEKSVTATQTSEKISRDEKKIVEPKPPSYEEKIAAKYVNYRLGFVHFFYKKREIEAQIKAEKKNLCETSNAKITKLQQELNAHLKSPPKAFIEDHVHNDIILHLLDKTDERGIPLFNFPEITKNTIGAALKPLTCQQDLNDFIYSYTEEGSGDEAGKRVLLKYFIRDIMQVKTPLTICDLVLHDAIMDTASVKYGFVQLFDEIVDKVNAEISRLHSESEDTLMPTVLRPIGKFANLGHRDAIQLIPPMQNNLDQFAGAILEDTTIQDNIISSVAKLQGIFSTDGAFRNLKIINNKIATAGEHKISILGMLSGEVRGNTDLEGGELDIKIQPLRLGGGTPITNFFVLGFAKNCSYQYEHIEGITGTKVDRRTKKVVLGKGYDPRKYLLDFDMDYFTEAYQFHDKPRGRFEAIKEIIDEMIENGKAVKANSAALDALEHGLSQEIAIGIATQAVEDTKTKINNGCDPRIQQKLK